MNSSIQERIRQALAQYSIEYPLMEVHQYPGFAVAVLVDGFPIVRACRGAEDIASRKPIGTDTEFRIASVTKQFTCALILALEQKGMLSLDDSVSRYLPLLRLGAAGITLRQLCWNTSGIRDYFALATLSGMTRYGGFTRRRVQDLIEGQVSLNFPPGSQERYSNSNYVLLTRIAEKVCARTFDELLKTHLFVPLGMHRSSHLPWATENRIGFSLGYQLNKHNELEAADIDSELSGEGGICSTLSDLILWEQAFDNGIPGLPGVMKQLAQRPLRNSRAVDGYGFGLQIGRYRGETLEQHGGFIPGYRAQQLRFPDARISVIALSNGPIDAGRLALQLADICLDERGIASSQAPAPVRATAEHRRYLGFYPDPATFMGYSLKESDGQLQLRLFGLDKPLYQLDEEHIGDSVQSSFAFVLQFGPDPGAIIVSTCASEPREIHRSEPAQGGHAGIPGHYYSEEIRTHYRIFEQGEGLGAEIDSEILQCQGTYPLQSLGRHIYRIDSESLAEVLLFFSEEEGPSSELRATVIRAEAVLFRRMTA